MSRFATRFGILTTLISLAGCATSGNPRDPLEGFNRAMFKFNDAVDQAAVKPAAQVYQQTLPSFVQTGIGNFFSNLADIPTGINNLLQGKMADGVTDLMRVVFNSTLGLGGTLNIASEAGMPKHKEDFGETLGKWGVASGPYIVLPILGPSTVRDSVALPLDFAADPWLYKYPVRWRNTGTAVRLVDQRAALLNTSNLLEDAALDRYQFVRDAFLQRRESQVYDGDTPPKHEYDENGDAGSQNGLHSATGLKGDMEPASTLVVKLKEGNNIIAAPSSLPYRMSYMELRNRERAVSTAMFPVSLLDNSRQ